MKLVLVAVATALVAAGGAGGAPAAHTFPKLLVHEHGRSTTIEIVHDDLDDAAADLAILAPPGPGHSRELRCFGARVPLLRRSLNRPQGRACAPR